MKNIKFLAVFVLFLLVACEDYVSDVDPFIDRMVDEALNIESQIPLLKEGVIKASHETAGFLFLMSDGLSDALVWDQNLAGATYTGYRQLEETLLTDENSETNSQFNDCQYARFLADNLINRIKNELTEIKDQAAIDDALYHSYLYSGYTRYLLGTYYGSSENIGGSTIDNGPFKSTSDLYDEAISTWNVALQYATDANDIKIIHSLIGRCHFFLEDYANAAAQFNQGLAMNDAPLLGQYDLVNVDNAYRSQASTEARIQWRLDSRFGDYVAADATEANRIKFKNYSSTTLLEQTMYVQEGNVVTPIPLIDWQEVAMMQAELIVRGFSSGDALALINEVRASQSVNQLAAGTVVELTEATPGAVNIYDERDKALFLRGLRLIDQRRFDLFQNAYGWKYFPLPRAERVKNPNLP
jgi:tetratricopeptide (TPR) repeat protein